MSDCRCRIVGMRRDPHEPHIPSQPEYEQADDCPVHPLPAAEKGHSKVVFLPHIADVEAPTLTELAAGEEVPGIESVEIPVLRYVHQPTAEQLAEEARWQRLHDEGGTIVDPDGTVIAVIGPATPDPDAPDGAFIASLELPKPKPEIQGHSVSWVEFDETWDFSKMTDAQRATLDRWVFDRESKPSITDLMAADVWSDDEEE